jgi:hypothetical protein
MAQWLLVNDSGGRCIHSSRVLNHFRSGGKPARASGDGAACPAVLLIAIRVSRPSSKEAAKALIIHASLGDTGGNPCVDYSSSVSHQCQHLSPW